jgi:small-conductance mechanosensitive channel
MFEANIIEKVLTYELFSFDKYAVSVYNILIIVGIILLSKLLAWSLSKFYYKNFAKRKGIDEGRIFAIDKITRYFIYTIALIFIVQSMGINITLLIAGSAALLVGVGIGLQQTFNDLVSGLIILFEGSIKIGDIVEVNEMLGIVRVIGVRTSTIETRDQIMIIVPNSKFINNNVINWSHSRRMTRLRVSVQVSYGTDEELVKKVLNECAAEEAEVEKNPRPSVRMAEFQDSGIEFELLYYTRNIINIGRLKSNLRFSIYKKFRENGIVIPFPQRDVHMIDKKGKK